ncbi:MAG: hypothetical protein H6810_11750 [Phycisphaeraceae bacterium]|nr:MAG: hypothetical protein H6810_11750 [Phycisphaeraceae bacterium]
MDRTGRCTSLLLVALLGLLSGCASPWKSTFQPATAEVFSSTDQVVIREVPWKRIDSALKEIDAARVSSDVAPAEMSPEARAAEHADLVRALQLSEAPESVVILGRSVFKSTSNIKLLDGSLSKFARSIGADYAIWSTTYLGKAQTVEQESYTREGYTYRRFRHRDGRIDYDYIPYQETLFVPVVVERDQNAWIVYYARVVSP